MGNYLIRIEQNNISILQNGKVTIYNKGDWVSVGRMEASSLVSQGKGSSESSMSLINPERLGFQVIGNSDGNTNFFYSSIPVQNGLPDKLPFDRTVFFKKGYNFKQKSSPGLIRNPARLSVFSEWLIDFDVCLILMDYVATVADTRQELEVTKTICHDLRILSYQDCAVGISNTKGGKSFYKAWKDQQKSGTVHALLRALFLSSPTVTYFAPDWGV